MEEKLINWFGPIWREALGDYLKSPEFLSIGRQITETRKTKVVYPESSKVFRCFKETSYDKVTVCLIAMDPYNTKNAADGLAFSCSGLLHPRPGLKNMLLEIESEYPQSYFDLTHFRIDLIDLTRWAKQNILLLNAALTVEEGKAGSHSEIWKPFTIKVIEALNKKENVVYLLLGKDAQSFEKYISTRHRIVSAPHPSAEAYSGGKAGFFGSNCFKQINECLKDNNQIEIIW